jgi:antitoxin (DNA-binding transcriptional repressor) of toxin-antitoxin stability system
MARKSITYRDLRNTPRQVFERLAAGEPLSLMSEGEAKALLIPIEDGDVETAMEAWRRGRSFMALSRLQQAARASGAAGLGFDEIEAEVKAVRKARRKRETG